MKQLPELLAPAGGPEQLRAAVENGADAVYMGLKRFNARQNADNFSGGQLKEAIAYAHVRGVNVYITLNTLIADSEMRTALDQAGLAYEAGADALIVQDLGFASLLRRMLPDMPLHLSTQGSIYNREGVQLAAELGFSRVVLARELSGEEIRRIAADAPIETEVFIHGALCVCYSGQCLMSSLIGGRSGNRGDCAQPCRLPYRLSCKDSATGRRRIVHDTSHLLSPKDLCLLPQFDEVIRTGAAGLKIEGRAKSPEYVAVVTRIYRKYLDLYAKEKTAHQPLDIQALAQQKNRQTLTQKQQDMRELAQIFNRGGFTTGYMEGKQGFEMMAAERSKHWGVYIGQTGKAYPGKKMVDIHLDSELSIGDGIEIVTDGLPGNVITSLMRADERVTAGLPGDIIRAGYIQGRIPPGSPVYKISEREQLREARASFERGGRRKCAACLSLFARKGKKLTITVETEPLSGRNAFPNHACAEIISSGECEPAITKPLTEERAREQLSKTGNTPFYIDRCRLEMDEDIAVPVSALNELRRKALAKLEAELGDRYPHRHFVSGMPDFPPEREAKKQEPDAPVSKYKAPGTSLYFFRWDGPDRQEYEKADRIYLPYEVFLDTKRREALERFQRRGTQLVAAFAAITKGYHDEQIQKYLPQIAQDPLVHGVMIANLGHLAFVRGLGKPVYADCSLNIYNSYTAYALGQLGVTGVSVSYELREPLSAPKECLPEQEIITGGKAPAMYSEYCPASCHCAGAANRKKKEKTDKELLSAGKTYELIDRMEKSLTLVTDCTSCRAVIFGAEEIQAGRQKALHKAAAAGWRINITHP